MSKTLTDNSYLAEKIKLRLNNLPDKKEINVLDMFSGNGLIWKRIKKQSQSKINVLRMEKKKDAQGVYLRGDNRKYIINYDQFDLIDLDAYGVPHKQLEKIFKQSKKELGIFITFIQIVYGQLPFGFLEEIGYSRAMIKKIPNLFMKNGQQKLLNFLTVKGVRNVKIYYNQSRRKNYLFFKINEHEQ